MHKVTSKDGTTIAYDQVGRGPVVIFVDGALQYRAFGQGMGELADLLGQHFTVIHYDRRGRGDSGDTLPYSLDREIEDIEAIIDAAGGSASLYGISSGACLALEAALTLGGKVKKLALYEPPYNDDPAARQGWQQYTKDLAQILAAGRKGDAVARFIKLVGAPDEAIAGIRQMPDWPLFEAVGHTLAYDAAAMGENASVPVGRAARLSVPTLVMAGGASFPFMHATAKALADAIPSGQYRTLEGQTHEVASAALAPVLVDFFGG